MPYVNQTTGTPTNKVASATVFGAVAAIISFLDDKYWGDQIPGYIEAAIITLAVFVAGYFTKNKIQDSPPGPGVVDPPVGD